MKIKPFTKQTITIPVGEVDLSDGYYFEVHLMQLETTVTRRPVLVTLNSLEDNISVEHGAGSGCKVTCNLTPEQTAPFKGPHFPFHQDPENRCWAQVHYINSDSSVVGMTDPMVVEVGDVIHPGLIEYKEATSEETETEDPVTEDPTETDPEGTDPDPDPDPEENEEEEVNADA